MTTDTGPALISYAAYDEYIGVQRLHALLQPRTANPAEVSFIVATQVMELLFGLLRHEWTAAQDALRTDDLAGAEAALRRGLAVQSRLVDSWDLLAGLTPPEFNAFRAELGEASGFQSATYLQLQFLLGHKATSMIDAYRELPDVHADLTALIAAPSLYDDVLAFLHRQGLPIPGDHLQRDLQAPYQCREEVTQAWRLVYKAPRDSPLVRFAEVLVDLAELSTRWRQRHLNAVKRTIGDKPGTGGSSGLTWLRRSADRDDFPELWAARDGMQ
jgi:tryptophan 2,3-dioxygenase